VELIEGHIYLANADLYVATYSHEHLILFQLNEEDARPIQHTPGAVLGYAQMQDGTWLEFPSGVRPSTITPRDLPRVRIDLNRFEEVAVSREDYFVKRARGHFRLKHGHVYQDDMGTFLAYRDKIWYLFHLKSDEVAGVDPIRGAILGYLQGQDGAWHMVVAGDPEQGDPPTLFVPCELDLLQLKDVGDDAFDYMTDKNFRDLMRGMTL
jgi:hypothetical protein